MPPPLLLVTLALSVAVGLAVAVFIWVDDTRRIREGVAPPEHDHP